MYTYCFHIDEVENDGYDIGRFESFRCNRRLSAAVAAQGLRISNPDIGDIVSVVIQDDKTRQSEIWYPPRTLVEKKRHG